MQTELEKLDGLKRKLKITLPVEEVKSAYEKHLKNVIKQVNLPGFRPGKVPVDIVEKKYGAGLKNEVAGELMQGSFEKALEENKLKIAGQPHVHPEGLEKDKPFEYVAEFEVYPEIALEDLSSAKFEKLVSEVTDADVATMLEKIQRQQAEWDEVERDAKDGDRLLIDFVGTIDGETFEGGAAKDFALELGSKQMIPGFEEGLVGAKSKEMKKIKVTFPKEYPAEKLAGKEAEFEVTVNKIEEPRLAELNDDLAKKIGVEGGIDTLKKQVREGMERELKQATEARIKMSVLDKLIELNPIDVPEALVNMEIQNLQNVTRQQMAGQYGGQELPEIDLPRDPYVEQATKRVKLGLLLGEVIKAYNISVDAAKVREKVEEIAAAYRKPQEVVDWYYGNKQMLGEVEALVVEDQAVQTLLGQAEVNEKTSSYDDVINLDKQ